MPAAAATAFSPFLPPCPGLPPKSWQLLYGRVNYPFKPVYDQLIKPHQGTRGVWTNDLQTSDLQSKTSGTWQTLLMSQHQPPRVNLITDRVEVNGGACLNFLLPSFSP